LLYDHGETRFARALVDPWEQLLVGLAGEAAERVAP
jgi:hypothetical protein